MTTNPNKNARAIFLRAILTLIALASNYNVFGGNGCDHLYLITVADPATPDSQLAESLRFGYMNCKGEAIVRPDYDEGEDFNGGIGVLRRGTDSYLVDASGRIKKLSGIIVRSSFSEGLAIAQKGSSLFVIDKKGNLRSKLATGSKDGKLIQYDQVGSFSNGLAAVSTTDGFGFIDKSGKFIIEPEFDYTNGFFEGIAVVHVDGKSALINTSGKYVLEPMEDTNLSILDASDGLAQVYKTLPDKENLIRFYDKNGTLALSVKNYDYVGRFADGLAAIKVGDKWGFIDRKGNIVVKPQFDQVREFQEGLAAVRLDQRWGFINRRGDLLIEPRFSDVREGFNLGLEIGFKHGLAFVEQNDTLGYINRKGDWVWSRKISPPPWANAV